MKFKVNYEIYPNDEYAYSSDLPSLTLQAPSHECDINTIIAKYHSTGFLPPVLGEPIFGDVSELSDLHTVLARQDAARELFYNLPSSIREKLNNDPMELLARSYDPVWCSTTGVDIGLFQRPDSTASGLETALRDTAAFNQRQAAASPQPATSQPSAGE